MFIFSQFLKFQICKFFLDAVEKSKYGWFWECPNGENCIYRHALPVGYVLKKDKKQLDDKKTELSLVDLIESERAALGANQTKVTLESFLAWKKRKIMERKDKQAKEEEKKLKDFKSGRQFGISGREMFSFNPELANDGEMEDGDIAFDSYTRDDDNDDDLTIEYKELDLEALALGAQEVDGSGTVAMTDRIQQLHDAQAAKVQENSNVTDKSDNSEEIEDAAPINENLFLDEDLEGLDDELNELDLENGD